MRCVASGERVLSTGANNPNSPCGCHRLSSARATDPPARRLLQGSTTTLPPRIARTSRRSIREEDLIGARSRCATKRRATTLGRDLVCVELPVAPLEPESEGERSGRSGRHARRLRTFPNCYIEGRAQYRRQVVAVDLLARSVRGLDSTGRSAGRPARSSRALSMREEPACHRKTCAQSSPPSSSSACS